MTHVRLNSVVPNGVSGPEAGAINLIYQFLLKKHGQNAYSYISVNQIEDDLEEVMVKDGKKIYHNVRYASPKNFDSMGANEKNLMRLDILHSGLLLIAKKDGKLNVEALEEIKSEIIRNNFSFDITIKRFPSPIQKGLFANLIVRPETDEFKFFVQIEKDGRVGCQVLIYRGGTSGFYISDLFKFGKWKKDNEFILWGQKREVEIYINVAECKVRFVNLTPYEKAPYFEMFRTDISEEDRANATQDFGHSLPPEIAAMIRKYEN